jgi:hypothetical protein
MAGAGTTAGAHGGGQAGAQATGGGQHGRQQQRCSNRRIGPQRRGSQQADGG